MTDAAPKMFLCRKCDGLLGDCGGRTPGCPVTKASDPIPIRKVLAAYSIVLMVLGYGLYMLWSNGSP